MVGKAEEFESLKDVAEYLHSCRVRRLDNNIGYTFEPHGIKDRTSEVRSYFREHPEYQVGISDGLRFLGFSCPNLERLDQQLPQELNIVDAINEGRITKIEMAKKYT